MFFCQTIYNDGTTLIDVVDLSGNRTTLAKAEEADDAYRALTHENQIKFDNSTLYRINQYPTYWEWWSYNE